MKEEHREEVEKNLDMYDPRPYYKFYKAMGEIYGQCYFSNFSVCRTMLAERFHGIVEESRKKLPKELKDCFDNIEQKYLLSIGDDNMHFLIPRYCKLCNEHHPYNSDCPKSRDVVSNVAQKPTPSLTPKEVIEIIDDSPPSHQHKARVQRGYEVSSEPNDDKTEPDLVEIVQIQESKEGPSTFYKIISSHEIPVVKFF